MNIFHHSSKKQDIAALKAHCGKFKLLSWATGPQGALYALVDRFVVAWVDQPWNILGWQEILSGGWRQPGILYWQTLSGQSNQMELTTENDFPQIFKERVDASFVMRQCVDIPGGKIIISARRILESPSKKIFWHVQPVGNIDISDPEIKKIILKKMTNARQDYT